MLWHVYQGVLKSQTIKDVWILSDSQEVIDIALSWGANALITSEDCDSGTDRIASVIELLDAEVIVNVQADEPLISNEVIDKLVNSMAEVSADVITPIFKISTLEDLLNPNVVKVARGQDGTAIYFSRSAIPHLRGVPENEWLNCADFWGHTGVYAFRRDTLIDFPALPEGQLEKSEKLEQLRLIESGKKIHAVEIDYRSHAVDTPADLEAVKDILRQNCK